MRGTPCKYCSRSQQRSSPGLWLRLTALLVLIARAWWISHSLITSSALDNIWQSTYHKTCGRRSCRPARYLSSSTHSHTSKRCLATALRVFLNHYRTLRTNMCVKDGDVPQCSTLVTCYGSRKNVHVYISVPADMPEDSPQTPQHPPKESHRPEGTWGNLTKEREYEISTAK